MRMSCTFKMGQCEGFNEFIKREPELEAVLNHPNVIDEIKSGNIILERYFKNERLNQLLAYITEEPLENEDERRSFRYPFVVSEIFCSNYTRVFDTFFDNPDLLHTLFSVFGTENPANNVLLGYFTKAFNALYQRNPRNLLSFLFKNEYEKLIINQLQSQSAADVIYKCLIGCQTGEDHLEQRLEILEVLINKLSFESNQIIPYNAEMVITKAISTEPIYVRSYQLIVKFMSSPEVLEVLFDNLRNSEALKYSARVLKVLMQKNKELQTIGDTLISESGVSILESYAKNIDVYLGVLLGGTAIEKMDQISENIKAVGEGRILVTEILNLMVSFANPVLCEIIAESGASEILTKLFDGDDWNSIFHGLYYNYVEYSVLSDSHVLKESLIVSSQLPRIIMKHGNNPFSSLYPSIRKGKMGHITKLANLVCKNEIIDQFKFDIADIKVWNDFIRTKIDKQNQIEEKELGANSFSLDSSTDEDTQDQPEIKLENKESDKENVDHNITTKIPEKKETIFKKTIETTEEKFELYWKIPVIMTDVLDLD